MRRQLLFQRPAHASGIAILGLVVANAIPLLGVMLLGWSLPTLIALYWAENGVVGFFAVARMLTARGRAGAAAVRSPGGAIVLVPFFIVHYGLFWLIHGVFVWGFLPVVLGDIGRGDGGMTPSVATVVLTLPFLFASHALSFELNWMRGGERDTSNPQAEMAAPYARVVVLHLTIIFGAFAVAALGAPIWALVVMVGVKTLADVGAHLAERGRAAARASQTGVALPVRRAPAA